MKILVRWNQPRIMSIGTGLADGSVIRVIPGLNELTEKEWEILKKHPDVIERMKKDIVDPKRGTVKMLEIVTETKKTDNGDNGEATISELGIKKAQELVKETFSTELLREWKESETRKGVIDAIDKQLAAIDKERENSDSQES